MCDDDFSKTNLNVEVSVGWNSPPPKLPFLDSIDSGDVSMNSSTNNGTPDNQNFKEEYTNSHPNMELLGAYSSLLPVSSPPHPRIRVRKRKPESPLRSERQADQRPLTGAFESVMVNPPIESKRQMTILSESDDLDDLSDFQSKQVPNVTVGNGNLNNNLNLDDDNDDTDSDLEDLLKITTPVKFSATYFANRGVERYVVQRVQQLSTTLQLHCSDAENHETEITLKGSWMETAVKRGDTVHLISINNKLPTSSSQPKIVADNADLLIVVNPDILVPCTSVAEALSCERQVILRNQVRVPADLNENLVLGSIKHEFIQTCFTANTLTDTVGMEKVLEEAVIANTLDLQLVDLDVPTAMKRLVPIIPGIKSWAESLWGPQAAGRSVEFHSNRDTFKVKLNRVAYIEEEIRSPSYGLVGKIDITCEASEVGNPKAGSKGSRLIGVEIKTGKSTQSTSHRAQTSLYTLLLAERHPYNTHPWSLLYYSESGTTIAVTTKALETRALIQQRNKVAYEMWHSPPGTLPLPTSKSEAICSWCSRSTSCILYTAVVDGGNTWGTSALANIYTKVKESGKLLPSFLKFIKHWHYLLELEHETFKRPEQLRARQWWLDTSVPIIWGVANQEESPAGHTYTMKIQENAGEVLLKPEDFIILSTRQHMGITFGLVVSVQPDVLKICVQDKLLTSAKYRIDAESWPSDSHLGLAKFNLNSLLEHDRLRELIVDLVEPKFDTLSTRKLQSTVEWASNRVLPVSQSQETTKKDAVNDLGVDTSLNEDQTLALNKVLSAKDYALILGMPGTGKTTTIAAIVASLVQRGKSVLLSAYTNSAVDTIVLKLLAAKIRCMRLATRKLEVIHPDVLPVAVSSSGASGGGTSLTDFLDCPVVACTSHSATNKLFALRKFDYCILDEASQITLPFCIGPLRMASTFVLVGDHYQLPPLVRNLRAKELGLKESLFKILCEAHPSAVVELRRQYRMCADIMSLSSDLIYKGRLICGSESVARQKLELSYSNVDPTFMNLKAIDPEKRVIFLNTDSLGLRAYERVHDEGSSNPAEADIISGIVSQFNKAGLEMRNLAVISVYRQQLSHLSSRLKLFVEKGLEILTADQAQGRDKCCIIVSLVKSNDRNHSGELLKDWRRLNVAFTRAKQKLVIVGSKRTVRNSDGVSSFIEYIDKKGWVCDAKML